MLPDLPVAVLPEPAPADLMTALHASGVRLVPPARAEGVIWTGEQPSVLAAALERAPSVRWVQLASAGVESYLPLMDQRIRWSRAVGVQSELVAEHALMLALTVLRQGTASVRAGAWLPRPAIGLTNAEVLVVGGGGVARALLALLRPFRVRPKVVCRGGAPIAGAEVGTPDRLDEWLPEARVVFLAAPLTADTAGLIDAVRLRSMRRDACLVNVARGGLVITDDLVRALASGWIAGAGLDVTDPEPLPPEHPLWSLPTCVITAHCAGDLDHALGPFVDLVRRNIRRLANGLEPIGLVDRELGY
ncbi:NAD(P)-dependent oxidoreductase [Streptomyces sp. NPDC127108]|uniref:NAD(P)-dependent oxidoreductase n=1 Tax=Streptomyces sp. NPDC127108 TaxID=3345361 RepID=UPI0036454AA4